MGRESEFLEYNVDNIMTSLLQAEDHLRVLYGKGSDNEGHNSCVVKHLFIVSGEAGEAVSHSSVTDPGKTETFREIKDDTDSLRKNINSMDASSAIGKVRAIRKKAEKLDPSIDTEHCEACSLDSKFPKNGKALNTESDNYFIMKEDTKQVLTINGGQFVGKAVTDLGGPQIDAVATPGAELPFRASTWLNIVGGVALQLVGIKYLKKEAKLGAVVVGSHMVSKIVNYALEATMPGTAVRRTFVRPTAPSVVGNAHGVSSF